MRRRARKGGGRQLELRIKVIGAQGDGIALYQGRPVFVPFTLPGDHLRVRLEAERHGGFRATPLELLAEGEGRREPPCPHFGTCGGCQLQHLAPEHYRAWKERLIPDALERQGIEGVPLRAPIFIPPGSRRRAALTFRRRGGRLELGFHERHSRAVVDLETCLLLTPELLALLEPLRQLLEGALPGEPLGDVLLLHAENGFDLLLITPGSPDLVAREEFVKFASEQKIARLSWAPDQKVEPERLFEREAPVLTFGKVAVNPPPGGFLQPSREGEKALVKAVLEALPERPKRIADLYAGCGSFTFPLAERASVTAVEGDAAALASLWAAARRSGLAGPIMVEQRDLVRQPLRADELAAFDVVVFDPPRQGAREQAREIATSEVLRVVAVSCHPASFARDARLLIEGGYRLDWIQPVDQFPWAAHLELVACFSR